MNQDLPRKYLEGIRCFNEGQYFECHELLESLWLEAGGTQEIFYQALIQAAVAIYHLEGKNIFGAVSLYRAAIEKLSKVPDEYMCLSVREFETGFKLFFEPYLALKDGSEIQIHRSGTPQMKLVNV